MSFYNWVNESILLPSNDLFFNRSINKHLKFLEKSQWWSTDQLKDYQDEKLKLLIEHAYKNVPYYNEVFKASKLTPEDIQTQDDLYKLPILTKEIIRKNFPDKIVAKNMDSKTMVFSGSSGSTGQPLQYYRTLDALSFSRACNLRGWYWMGFRLGDPYMKISTMPRNSLYKKVQDFVNNCYHVYSKSLSIENIEFIINTLRKSNVKIIRGYPASLYIIATYLEKNEINDIHVNAINTTSEPLYPHMRELIEKQFHCSIFDSYAAEGGAIISQCENHGLYHISSEKSIAEFYRKGEIVTEGRAKVLFTDLTNYATPFIRYDVKDYVYLDGSTCSCGRGLPTITKIEGRDTDILITPNGKYITFYFLAGYFEHQDYIDMFQLVQKTQKDFELKIVVNENYTTELSKMIHHDMIKVLGDEVNLLVSIVDEIPLTTSGKRRFFIRDNSVPLHL